MQPTKQQVKVRPIGPFIVNETFAIQTYYVEKDASKILIDLAPLHKIEQMIDELLTYTSIPSLTHIIISNIMENSMHQLLVLREKGFMGTIITNQYTARQYRESIIDLEILTIESLSYEFSAQQKLIFKFIEMHFLPFPDMFMIYEPESKTLFSSLLMSSYHMADDKPSLYDIEKSMFSFHKELMPSSDYIKPVMRKLSAYEIDLILPTYGYPISSPHVTHIIAFIKKMDFHNNYFMNSKTGNAQPELNYIELINQLIATLNKHYPRIEILNTFVGTAFNLDHETLLLKKTSLVAYKIWHQFFEVVYAKKGMSWLILMEPTMLKLMERYQLELPSIYRTETLKLQEERRALELQKETLESNLKALNEQIEQAKDQLLRDDNTSLYTQEVLTKVMYETFEKPIETGRTRGLLLIQLDQLMTLNKKYGKVLGNEAIQHLVYVLEQVKSTQVMLFKEKGPGVYALLDSETEQNILNEALKFRNSVQESTHFIEQVSISIAVVTCTEVDKNLSPDDKIQFIFSTIEKRMAYAKLKENGTIIDQQVELPPSYDGSILLVDQDEINRNMLFRIFKRIHFNVIMADSVDQALDIMSSEKIDVVISEINLSKLDGFQLKLRMNESKAFKDIPFIMVSHNKSVDNIKRGNLLDVDLILEKPIVPDELIGHVIRMKGR